MLNTIEPIEVMPENIEDLKGMRHTGAMLALYPSPEEAQSIYEQVNGYAYADQMPEDYHITLAYLGDIDTIEVPLERITRFIQNFIDNVGIGPIEGDISGTGIFTNSEGDKDAWYASFDSIEISRIRNWFLSALQDGLGIGLNQTHGFIPHITLGYLPPEAYDFPILNHKISLHKISFNQVYFVWGDYKQSYNLVSNPDSLSKSISGFGIDLEGIRSMAEKSEKSKPAIILTKSITETEDGDVIIPVIGVPFRGPVVGGKDLHGEYFDENTDIGALDVVHSYFDHRTSADYIPEEINGVKIKGFGEDLQGLAHRGEKTEEGWIYNIIIDRHNRYKHLLQKLAEKGVIGASSEVSYRKDDPNKPGRIDKWHVTALDLTPTMSNPLARALMKSFFLEEVEHKELEVPTKDEQNSSEDIVIHKTKASDAVKAMLAEENKTEAETVEVEEEATEEAQQLEAPDPELLKSINTRLEKIEATLSNLDPAKVQKNFKDIADGINDIQEAFEQLPSIVSKNLRGEIGNAVAKSKPELEAEDVARKLVQKSAQTNPNQPIAGKLPPHAPGQQRRSQ